jgi:hypothetical protein
MSLNIEHPESTTYWIIYNDINYVVGFTEPNQVTDAVSWSLHLKTTNKDEWLQEQENLGVFYKPTPNIDQLETNL